MRRWIVLVLLWSGCQTEPTVACDLEAATEVVYDADGLPAYPGQALLITSCGAGGFCHAEGIPHENRHGAPAGLEFDLTLASTGRASNEEEAARLARAQDALLRHRSLVMASVESGSMPPDGVGAEIVANAPHFDRLVGFEPPRFEPLPDIGSEEGLAILRNFAACGYRVVERTQRRTDEGTVAGTIESAIERRCADPTWPSIHALVIAPSCAGSACHDAVEPSAGLDLSAGQDDLGQLAARLVGAPAGGSICEGSSLPQIDPGFDPMRSLLYVKVAGGEELCGRTMPLVGNALSDQRLCAIREWIACGACGDPGDPRCADCTAAARDACGVVLGPDGPECTPG